MIKNRDCLEKKKGLIDLHMHTSNSDGEESPDVVVEKARSWGAFCNCNHRS